MKNNYKTLLKSICLSAICIVFLSRCDVDDTMTAASKDVHVDFKLASASVMETGDSYEVELVFNQPIETQSTVEISFQTENNANYKTNFTTVPAADSNTITLEIAAGEQSTSFMFNPVMDPTAINSGNIIFKIESITGKSTIGLGNEFFLIYRETAQIVTSIADAEFPETYSESSNIISYTLNSIGLTENVELSATENFTLSTDDITYSEDLEIDLESINNTPKTIYVKFTPESGTLGQVEGRIRHISDGVETVAIALTGTALANVAEVIVDTETLTFSLTVEGQVSAPLSYTVSATNLLENIDVTAPALFEISLDDIAYSETISLDFENLNAGNEQIIFVRFLPLTANEKNVTGVITHHSLAANTPELTVNGSVEYDYQLIAYTSFEEPQGYDVDYVDTGDANVDHELVNNPGQAPVQYTSVGGELGFRTFYISTGGVGATDGDDLGVTTKTSIVGRHLDGVQSYYADDTDGIIKLILDPIDVSNLSQLKISLGYLFNTGFDPDDFIKIYVENEDTRIYLLNVNGPDIVAQGTDDQKWHLINAELNVLIGPKPINIIFEVETNSNSEEVYFDDIKVFGVHK